jgi:hypothetical protein
MRNTALVSTSSIQKAFKSARLFAIVATTVTTWPYLSYAEQLSLDCDVTVVANGSKYALRAEINDNELCEIRADHSSTCYTNNKENPGLGHYKAEYFRNTPIEIAWGSEVKLPVGFSSRVYNFDSTIV